MYNKYKTLLCSLFLVIFCFSQQLHSGSNSDWASTNLKPHIHQYSGLYTYDGDAQGNYVGDYAVILTDGSAWKIHSSNNSELATWDIGDKIHVEVRTYWYFYRRDHKFMLYNHKKNKWLYAMLVYSPLRIYESGIPTPSATMNGAPTDYKKNLTLTNQSLWEVDSYPNDARFPKGNHAYASYNATSGSGLDPNKEWGTFFVITGRGKDAEWDWARRGNYEYIWK